MIYPLVRELAVDGIPVTVTCRVLKIARQPYYRWLEDTVTKATVELNKRFQDLCAEVAGAAAPMTLAQQADHIANGLRADLIGFLQQMPAVDVIRTYGSSPLVARVAVTGYGERGPESVVLGLGIATERNTNRWEVQVQPLSRLAFSGCGVRFHGQESVVSALRTDNGKRIPKTELQRPDVSRLTTLLKGECGGSSTQDAAAMFLRAVRLTITLGPGFAIPSGSVSLPVDVITIPRDGAVDVQRVTSW